ncbi:MAG: PaaI family thioesterase [Phycisphaerales bacterium]|nr:MAG: PaaI family thioesterase [Phycisphaerales bacterium]
MKSPEFRQKERGTVLECEHGGEILDRIKRIPIVDALGIQIDELGEGRCMATVPRDTRFDGIFESFHGGILLTIADSIACFAILTLCRPGQILTTTDMSICFLGPCFTDVTADARVIKLGRTLCPVAVDLFDTSRQKVALAHVKYIRLGDMPKRSNAKPARGSGTE